MRRYLEGHEDGFLNFNKEKKKQWAKERKPYSAFMELTPKCNMNCVHCYLQNHHGMKELSYKEITEIVDILYDKGIIFLTLSGGEIFTRNDFIDIYMYVKKKGFMVELFSNGLAITDEIIEVLRKYPPLLIDISIYGASEGTYETVTGISGAFNNVIDNCKKIKAAGIRMSLKSPVLKETCDEINAMRRIAEKIGVPFCVSYEIDVTIDNDDITKKHQLSVEDMLFCEFNDFLLYGKEKSNTDTDVDDIYEIETDSLFVCNVAQSSFIIDYEGRMCPCMKFRHRGKKLTKGNFDNIWKEFGEIQKLKASDSYKCKKCKARYYCDACAAEREFVLGDLEAIDEQMCKYALARYGFYREKMHINEAVDIVKEIEKGGDLNELL